MYRKEIVEKSKVSDYEAEQYYRDHKEEFSSSDTVVYRRIFFHVLSDASQAGWEKILAAAHSVLDELVEQKEFQKLMEEYSTDPPKYQTARYSARGDDSRMFRKHYWKECKLIIVILSICQFGKRFLTPLT